MLHLFFTFFKLGLFTFGGGYAMIPLIKDTIVKKLGWLTDDEVLEIIAISESTPGPIAINMATYIGYKRHGVWGSVFATLGVVIPSFVIIYLIAMFFGAIMNNMYVSYALTGIKCAVAVLILKTGIEMLVKMKKTVLNVVLFFIAFATILVSDILALNISAILLILLGGIASIVVYSIISRVGDKKEVIECATTSIAEDVKPEDIEPKDVDKDTIVDTSPKKRRSAPTAPPKKAIAIKTDKEVK